MSLPMPKALIPALTTVPLDVIEEVLALAADYANERRPEKRVVLRNLARDYHTGMERCAAVWKGRGDPRWDGLKLLIEDLVRDQAGHATRQGWFSYEEDRAA